MKVVQLGTLLLVAVGLLAGCGNREDRGQVVPAVDSGLTEVFGREESVGKTNVERVAAEAAVALKTSDLPLALVALEERDATALLTQIETNGAYTTWATPDRRTIIMTSGLLTGTRGLGYDLMNADLDDVARLIRTQSAGKGQRAMRYLDGENLTVALVAECKVTVGPVKWVSAGAIVNRRAIEMRENCQGGSRSFINIYLVDSQGQVIQSRQWLGLVGGYLTIQAL